MRLANRVYDTLRTNLRKGSYHSKPFAALALGIMGRAPRHAGNVEVFRELLRFEFREYRGDPKNRGAYALALGLLDDRRSIGDLAKVLADRGEVGRLRGACATALGLLGGPEAREVLARTLADPDDRDLRHDTVGALGLRGTADLEVMSWMLRDRKSPSVLQGAVAAALAQAGDRAAVDLLVTVAGDASVQDLNRAAAVTGLGLLVDPHDVPRLRDLSRDVNYRALVNVMEELLSML
jgi:HEAT repeat protein